MSKARVVMIGAGVGGLACATRLAGRGFAVTVLEAAAKPGGKMRTVSVGGCALDAGPTVLTMRWVFDRLFADAGARLDDAVSLIPARLLARHAWSENERLDLFADRKESAAAITRFAGAREGRRYLDFCDQTRRTYESLLATFMTADRPTPAGLVKRMGFGGVGALLRTNPFADMASALAKSFDDPRLRQLFGRYATYCGSSPYLAPATLMLVAHAEQEGVWLVDGGMVRLAQALASLAASLGAAIRCDAPAAEITTAGGRVGGVRLADGETLPADIVVFNADASALASGRFGVDAAAAAGVPAAAERSLSAMTFACVARTSGFPLVRHNVFFSADYAREFDALFARRVMPDDPTVYICAQDRDDSGGQAAGGSERLLLLINAPAVGDQRTFTSQEIAACEARMVGRLAHCGLTLDIENKTVTTPTDFETLFPATGGALYGAATHGAMATFARPASRTSLPGLYLAGGSVHPGPGVPMAALSGRIAAQAIMSDYASSVPSRPTAMPGGMSTR